jgi:hypothetical protein
MNGLLRSELGQCVGKADCKLFQLKGQCHEIFDPRFFSSNNPI